jgi:hypothetical protein
MRVILVNSPAEALQYTLKEARTPAFLELLAKMSWPALLNVSEGPEAETSPLPFRL